MEIVERTFRGYDEYLGFLINNTICDDPLSTANHERAHFSKARELGYDVLYGAKILGNDFPHVLLQAFVDFPIRSPTTEHLIEILLAPDTPGEFDIELADRLKQSLQPN